MALPLRIGLYVGSWIGLGYGEWPSKVRCQATIIVGLDGIVDRHGRLARHVDYDFKQESSNQNQSKMEPTRQPHPLHWILPFLLLLIVPAFLGFGSAVAAQEGVIRVNVDPVYLAVSAVGPDVWLVGPSVIAVGLLWHLTSRRLRLTQ